MDTYKAAATAAISNPAKGSTGQNPFQVQNAAVRIGPIETVIKNQRAVFGVSEQCGASRMRTVVSRSVLQAGGGRAFVGTVSGAIGVENVPQC